MEVLESCGGFPAASVPETPATANVDRRLSALTVHTVPSKCTSDQQKHRTGKDISSYGFLKQPQRPASDKSDRYHRADQCIDMKQLESTVERRTQSEPGPNRRGHTAVQVKARFLCLCTCQESKRFNFPKVHRPKGL